MFSGKHGVFFGKQGEQGVLFGEQGEHSVLFGFFSEEVRTVSWRWPCDQVSI